MDYNLIQFNIENILEKFQKETPRVIHKGEYTSYWNLSNMFYTFNTAYPSSNISQLQFLDILESMKIFTVIKQLQKIPRSLVCLRNNHSQVLADEIIKQQEINLNPIEEIDQDLLFPSKVRYDDFLSDEESSHAIKIEPVRTGKRKESTFKPIYNKEAKQPEKKLIKPVSYTEIKKQFIEALGPGIIFQTASFTKIMAEKHGSSFNYKTAPCKKQRGHIHGNLTKYIQCLDDLFKIYNFKQSYIKRTDEESLYLVEKRKQAHVDFMNKEAIKYHIESLIVNMFPIKTTLEIKELEEVFKCVYNFNLGSLFDISVINYLKSVKSPNMILKASNDIVKITCIPICDENYKEFGDPKLFSSVFAVEMAIQNKKTGIFIPTASIQNKIDNYSVNIKYSNTENHIEIENPKFNSDSVFQSNKLFKVDDPEIKLIIESADRNVPKSLQLVKFKCDINVLYKKCEIIEEDSVGVSEVWEYIVNSVRLK
ncbi:hypothetical protein TCON_2205 [Astathelohania contejeani]|uniref:Uncharacterized protein n=1 Tax=Astathelohania contejeani TaxID=164912 RepID=A0ABQ7HWQ9_9MICR|nr:hypothetical protein TCON_2205 [Thelohania contejeani]